MLGWKRERDASGNERGSEQTLGDGDDVIGLQQERTVAALGNLAEVDDGDGSTAVDADFFGIGEFGESAGEGDCIDEVEPAIEREWQRSRLADLAEHGDGFPDERALIDDDAVAGGEFDPAGASADRVHAEGAGGAGRADQLDAAGIGIFRKSAGGGHGGGEVEISRNWHRDLAGNFHSPKDGNELGGVFIDGQGQLGVDKIILRVEIADFRRGGGNADASHFDGADERKRCLTGFKNADLDREIGFLIDGDPDRIVGTQDVGSVLRLGMDKPQCEDGEEQQAVEGGRNHWVQRK